MHFLKRNKNSRRYSLKKKIYWPRKTFTETGKIKCFKKHKFIMFFNDKLQDAVQNKNLREKLSRQCPVWGNIYIKRDSRGSRTTYAETRNYLYLKFY